MDEQSLKLFKRCILRHFSQDELKELTDRPVNGDMRKQLAELDWEFFCKYYLEPHFTKPFADMHWELAEDFVDLLARDEPSHEVVAFPREFGKTTWVSLALVMYCIVFEKRHYIVPLAQSYDQAKDYLADIKRELEENERILDDFGDLTGQPWQASEIRTATGIRVKPLGSRMKLRGRKDRWQRPDLVIADDLEDVTTAQNERERNARKEWVNRTVLKAGTDNTVFFFVGNKVHNDGVIAMLQQNPLFRKRVYRAVLDWAERDDLWESWRTVLGKYPADADRGKLEARAYYEAHRREMDQGALSAWPEGRSYYALMVMLAVGGRRSFFAEMQNQPLTDEDRIFSYGTYKTRAAKDGEAWLVPNTGHPAVRLLDCLFFGAVDPSLGTRSSDPSAIIILARAPTGQMFVIVDDERNRSPYTIIENMQGHHKRFPTTRFAIEVVQFQALFATDAARESMKSGLYINYIQVPAKSNKRLRIESLEPPCKLHYVLLPDFGAEKLRYQMDNWPSVAHDDGLDALELAYRIASTFDAQSLPNIIEGESLVAGDGTLFSPQRDPFYVEAEALAHAREVGEALSADKEPPKELWQPIMRP